MADNVFSRHLHSVPLGRTGIPNSLFIIMESFAFVAACFIVFFDALIFFPPFHINPL